MNTYLWQKAHTFPPCFINTPEAKNQPITHIYSPATHPNHCKFFDLRIASACALPHRFSTAVDAKRAIIIPDMRQNIVVIAPDYNILSMKLNATAAACVKWLLRPEFGKPGDFWLVWPPRLFLYRVDPRSLGGVVHICDYHMTRCSSFSNIFRGW